MAIIATLLDDGSSTSDATSYSTVDSISPGADRLVLVAVVSGDTGGATTVPSVSGAGLTFTHVVGQQQGGGNQRVDIFRAMSASPGTGALTIDYGAVQQENCAWTIVEFDGVDTGGTNGADAIVQSKGGTDSGANIEVTLDNAVTSGNATFGLATGNTTSPTWSAGSGFVQIGATWSMGTPSNKGIAVWDVDGGNPVAFTTDGTPVCAVAAVEIATASGPVTHHASATIAGTATLSAQYAAALEPRIAVEVEFDPVGDPGTWTDLAAYFVTASTNVGRSEELGEFQAGTATVTLRNEDRRFDPGYASSPYAGNLKPGRMLRIVAHYDDGTGEEEYELFAGRIDGWFPQYEMPNGATVEVRVTDLTKLLESMALPRSVYALEVEADEPVAWWRLGNPATNTPALDQIGSRDLTFQANPRGGEALVTNDDNDSTFFDHAEEGSGNVAEGTATTPITGYPFTIEATFRSAKQADDLFRVLLNIAGNNSGGTATRWIELSIVENVIFVDPGRLVLALTDDAGATGAYWRSAVRVDDGRIHHVVVVVNSASDVDVYLDGSASSGGSSITDATPSLPSGTVQISLGNTPSNYPAAGEFGLDGELQDVILYDEALSSGRITAHYNAMNHPWQGDNMGQRVSRIMTHLGFSFGNDWFPVGNGTTTMQSAALNQSALSAIRAAVNSEFGRCFVSPAGLLLLLGQEDTFLVLHDDVVYGDDIAGGELGYEAIEMDYSDALIRNDVFISRNNGVGQRVVDSSSVTEYGTHPFTAEGLIHDSDSWSADVAEAIATRYAEPILRVTGMTVNPRKNPALMFPEVLNTWVADVITVRRRPPGGGDPFEQQCTVEGISHQLAPKSWRTTFRLSPYFEDPLVP